MTRRDLERLVELWRRRLGLERWSILVEWKEPEHGDARATTWRSNDYDEARIRVSPSALEDSGSGALAAELEVLVVHELLHLVTRDVEHVLDLVDELDLAPPVERMLRAAHMHAVEGAVDRLAYRIVELEREGRRRRR